MLPTQREDQHSTVCNTLAREAYFRLAGWLAGCLPACLPAWLARRRPRVAQNGLMLLELKIFSFDTENDRSSTAKLEPDKSQVL